MNSRRLWNAANGRRSMRADIIDMKVPLPLTARARRASFEQEP
jgi:hypothetical protein